MTDVLQISGYDADGNAGAQLDIGRSHEDDSLVEVTVADHGLGEATTILLDHNGLTALVHEATYHLVRI